jgi:hypothetical protein
MLIRFPVIATTLFFAGISLLSVSIPASAQNTITCESTNNRRNSCPIETRGRVRLVRQLSDSSCRGNWGYGRDRIWVRNGCRAEFAVGGRRYGRYGGYHRYNDYSR